MKQKNAPLLSSILFFIVGILSNDVIAQNKHGIDFAELDTTLQKEFAGEFEFSVRIESNDSILFTKNCGFTDINNSIPVNEKTLFNIASITKSITAVGIMKLVEQKEINLSDKLDLFFENVPKSKESISISTLLSHKSGLSQTYPLDGISESNQAVNAIFNEELEFTPGSGFRYSNQNYQLLALIIEKVAKTKYEEFIRKNVLDPLKMQNTYFWDEVKEHQNIAPLNKRILRRIGVRNWGFIGGAGVFTTTTDLSRFWNGIYKNEFLSKESIDIIFRPYYETTSGIQIGLGFYKNPNTKWNTSELWTRGTESWGHNSVIRFFPEKDLTILVSTNSGEIRNDNIMTGNRIISDLIADFLLK